MSVKRWKPFTVGLILLLSIGLLWLTMSRKKSNPERVIFDTLTRAGYSPELAKMFVAVSKHETGNYNSSLFKRTNNMFGMKQPVQRQTLSIGPTLASEGNFATFKSIEDSAKDFVLYLKAKKYPVTFPSLFALVQFMKAKNYFGDTFENYYKGAQNFL